MTEAARWSGGTLTTNTGARWYSKSIMLMWLMITRDFRITAQQPICTLTVTDEGITLRPRWRWFRPLVYALTSWMIREPMPSFSASWSEVSELRRTRGDFTSYSAIEFTLGDRRVGIASYRTRSLDPAWSAIVHFYGASRAASPDPEDSRDLLGSPSPTRESFRPRRRTERGGGAPD
jgi:hypothetical protein